VHGQNFSAAESNFRLGYIAAESGGAEELSLA